VPVPQKVLFFSRGMCYRVARYRSWCPRIFMNKRTIIIFAALALPVILLALVISSGAPSPKESPKNNVVRTLPAAARNATGIPPHPSLEQVRTNVKNRLAQLEKMTPEQWPEEKKTHPNAPATLQEAIENNKNRLAKLEAMTPEQWDAQFKPGAQRLKPVANMPAPQPAPQPNGAAQTPALSPAAGQ
jgi:hypothetical protein